MKFKFRGREFILFYLFQKKKGVAYDKNMVEIYYNF